MRMDWRTYWLPILILGFAVTGSISCGDEPVQKSLSHECRFVDNPPTIDGIADDLAWKSAQPIDRFTLPWLKEQERPARTATKARLAWDREFLYFIAEMDDGDLFADLTEHDAKIWNNDVFELFLKPAIDKTGYYEFQVNAAGTVLDMFLPKRSFDNFEQQVKEGDFHVDAKVTRNGTLNQRTDKDQGWTVEGRIPWTDFLRTGGRPAPGEVWKFALCRYDYSVEFDEPELSSSAPLQVRSFHQHEDYADLTFIGPATRAADQSKAFDAHAKLAKLTTSRVIGSPEPPDPYRTERRYPKLKVDFPIIVAHQPGSDRLWTITQDRSFSLTSIRRFVDSVDVAETEILLPPDNRVAYDICFHPDFANNGFVYIGHNRPKVEGGEKYSTISRFHVNPQPPYEFDPKSEMTIIEWASDGHNGAAITFGLDGMLYVTSGDGTSDSDTNLRGQEMSKLTAKVLRIDVDHPTAGKTYAIPIDNPFVGQADVASETWAYGLRNPWRMTTDRKTGHIWVGNNGQDLWEQVYFIRKGDNYGWSVYEGSHPFYLQRQLGPTPHVKPALEHHHNESRSLTGGIVYYGAKLPELTGVYVYGDHSTGKVWGTRHDGQRVTWHQELVDTPFHITGFGTDSHGELLICDHAGNGEGGYYALAPAPTTVATAAFPRKLSESGLFQSVKGHVTEPTLIPYSVNSPLWSDGSLKARFIAIPGDNPKIEFNPTKAWGFPNETVLVKSFAIETTDGDPTSKRWIETRLFTKQQNEWVGYSYAWNDEQTEASLVTKEGLDRNFTITTPEGSRTLPWHYPSRTECMVCHSRAAAFVLGLSTPQMNRDHHYGSSVENQLSVLERLGLFQDQEWVNDARNRLRDDLKKSGLDDQAVNAKIAGMSNSHEQRGPARANLLALPNDKYQRLADPYDRTATLEGRAKSYLHSNCAICHIEAGGGNSQMQLEFTTALDKMKIIDIVPHHDKFGIPDARIIAPGHPERSVLLKRILTRGRGQMPQLATTQIDQAAVEMFTEWINQLQEAK
jgi:glucose/arabinose dehydrogenase